MHAYNIHLSLNTFAFVYIALCFPSLYFAKLLIAAAAAAAKTTINVKQF